MARCNECCQTGSHAAVCRTGGYRPSIGAAPQMPAAQPKPMSEMCPCGARATKGRCLKCGGKFDAIPAQPKPMTDPDDRVERVARAIWRSLYGQRGEEHAFEFHTHGEIEATRCAIAAIAALSTDDAVTEAGVIERASKALDRRLNIYRQKRDRFSITDDDSMTVHETYALIVEAFEIYEEESGLAMRSAALPHRD